jgi:hypothetical protein
MYPAPSASSVIKTTDPQSSGRSVSPVEAEETPEKKKQDHDNPHPAGEEDIQMEYSSD